MYLRPEIEKILPNFYLFKQNMQAQLMQAISESKTWSFHEFGQTNQIFLPHVEEHLILGRGQNFSKKLLIQNLQLFFYKF